MSDLIVRDTTPNLIIRDAASVITSGTARTVIVRGGADSGASSILSVKDEGSLLTQAATSIDFVGAGVSASVIGSAVTVTITGGGGGGGGTVTQVTGTAPIQVATGTTTPVVSISAASGATAGSMSSADFTKLAAISGSNTGDETAAGILAKLVTVAGAGSGLDADLLDGISSAGFDTAGAAAAAQAASQPVDSDLTAIAALTTTAFGRGLLTLADDAALRTSFGTGTSAQYVRGDGTLATSTVAASNTDATTGTDTAKRMTAASVRSQRDQRRELLTIMRPGAGTAVLAATFDPSCTLTNGVPTLTSGKITAAAVMFYEGQVVTGIGFKIGTTAAVTPTNSWVCISDAFYPSGSTIIRAASADATTTAMASSTIYERALASTWTCPATGLYYIGLMVAAATAPSLIGFSGGAAGTGMVTGLTQGIGATSGYTTAPTIGTSTVGQLAIGSPNTPAFWAY